MRRQLPRAAAFVTAGLLLILATGLVLGKGILLDGKLRTGDTVIVPASETWHGDLYVLGGRVTVEGIVDGDLTALAGEVDVTGTVNGDLLAAGGNISISGSVGGDVRIAGGQLNVAGAIAEDVAATGGQVTVSGGSKIGGDLIVTGGQISVAGSVTGNVEGAAGSYSRSGSVGGTEHVVISPRIAPVSVASDTVLDAVRHFVVVVLIGALALWWLPRVVAASARVLRERPLLALGGGVLACLGYIAFLVGAVLAMVLLALLFGLLEIGSLVAIEIVAGTLAIGVGSFLFVLAAAFLADALVGLALARLAMSMALPSRWRELGRLAAGAAVVVMVTSIPIVGGWVKLAVILFGLGALTIAGWEGWRARRRPPPEPLPEMAPVGT
jgi:hypothetical protein